jgi:hypothetical protein
MTEPMSLSVVIQMQPMWRPDRPGVPFDGDLEVFAEQYTRYLVGNLTPFAEPRGADLFVAVVVKRGEDSGGHEYRDGAYVKMPGAGAGQDGEGRDDGE